MNRLFLCGALMLLMFVTSCSNENDVETPATGGKPVSVTAQIIEGKDLRVVYQDDGSKMKATWSTTEKFTMYNGASSTGSEFSNSSDAVNSFTGKKPEGEGNYFGVYGKNVTNTDGVLSVDIANQTGTSAENGITEFMVAESADLQTPFQFKHKLAVLKLTLELPSDVTGSVSKVTLMGLHNKANYKLADGSYEYATNGIENIVATNGTKGFAIESNKITAYVAVFPENVVANQVTIAAMVGENEYYYTLSGANQLGAAQVVPVTITWAKVMSINSGSLTVEAVRAALAANHNNLVLKSIKSEETPIDPDGYYPPVGPEPDEEIPNPNVKGDFTNDDFAVLKEAFKGYPAGSINLTLLNQEKFPAFDGPSCEGAFLNCTALKSVSAPNLTHTGQDCFMGCTSLLAVSFPKVEYVRYQTFSGCTSLTSVYLPEATGLGESSFSGCSSLASLYLPKVTDIGVNLETKANAFTGCPRGGIAVTVKDGTSWWKELGGDKSNKLGWRDLYVDRTSNFKSSYSIADYYQWDAIMSQEYLSSNQQYNKSGIASHSCKNAPTKDQISMYLGAGVYWDDGAEGVNQQTYKIGESSEYYTGLWMKKKEYISGWDEGSATKAADVIPTQGRPAASEIHKYFFLPSLGRYTINFIWYNLCDQGNIGYYWSSSNGFGTYYDEGYGEVVSFDGPYYLQFETGYAKLVLTPFPNYGIVPMVVE